MFGRSIFLVDGVFVWLPVENAYFRNFVPLGIHVVWDTDGRAVWWVVLIHTCRDPQCNGLVAELVVRVVGVRSCCVLLLLLLLLVSTIA